MIKPKDIVRTKESCTWVPQGTVQILKSMGDDAWMVAVIEDGKEVGVTIIYEDELDVQTGDV